MHVLQIGGLAGPGPIAGGVWAVAQAQTVALRDRGDSVRLVGGWMDDVAPTEDLVRVRPLFPGAGLRGLYARDLKTFLRRGIDDVDLVHVHLARDYLTTSALDILRDKPIVVQAHGMIGPPRSPVIRAFDRLFKSRYLTIPARWLVLTDAEEAALVSYGVDPALLVRIENAVPDPGAVLPGTATASDRPVFSFISRLHARKQPDVFVEAGVRLLDSVDADFRLVGPDQGAQAGAEQVVRDSGRGDRFRFVGALEPSGVLQEMRSATAVVLPSRGEVAPMIALECAAAGTPLVLTADCGLAEVFAAYDAAVVVDPTPEGIAEAMRGLVDDPARRGRLAANGRALYESRWSTTSLGEDLHRVYSGVLGEVRSS